MECKIATIEDMHKKWDYEIKRYPEDNRWVVWKEVAIQNAQKGNRICFYGVEDGEIIAEAIAIINKNDSGLERVDLIQEDGAYLEALELTQITKERAIFRCFINLWKNI